MRRSIDLLRNEPASRPFFAAHAQSSIGTGAAYVGLLLLAFERLPSPWAITLVLLADFLPAMLLGPVFGAAADRWPRRSCAVLGDGIRAVAFIGIAAVDSFAATLALALLAGAGTGLFVPTVLAGLPSLVQSRRLAAATSLYGALDDTGHMIGPGIAALVLLFVGPETLMAVNGATFALSAAVLTRVRFGAGGSSAAEVARRVSLLSEARSGLAATVRMPAVRTVLACSATVIVFAGMFNVGELLLAERELGASDAGFSVLVAVFGAGVVVGSLSGGRGGPPALIRRRWAVGLLVVAAGFAAAGLAPNYAAALIAFALAGVGNGLVLVHERLFVQRVVPRRLLGRVFGVRDTLGSWAFATAFLGAGALLSLVGTRAVFLIAAGGVLLAWAIAVLIMRREDELDARARTAGAESARTGPAAEPDTRAI